MGVVALCFLLMRILSPPANASEMKDGGGILRDPLAVAHHGMHSSARLLVATHSRLIWFNIESQEVEVLHEGQGIYYGHFPGEELDETGTPSTVWVVSRPHNWRPTETNEWLLQLDMTSGEEIRRMKIPSHFSHDAIRLHNKVYVASTGSGEVLQLGFPSMQVERTHKLFTLQQHVNTLSPVSPGSTDRLWAMLHNKGPSKIVEVDVVHGEETGRTLGQVGDSAHGLVHWRGAILVLDSKNAMLVAINPSTAQTKRIYQFLDKETPFLKGMAVVDDVAYIGVSAPSRRSQRNDPSLNSDISAVDLLRQNLLWRVTVPTHGLLNAISAPHLAAGSGYLANFLRGSEDDGPGPNIWQSWNDPQSSELESDGDEEAREEDADQEDKDNGKEGDDGEVIMGPDMVWAEEPVAHNGGKWASGQPFFSLKEKKAGLHETPSILPMLHLDVNGFADALRAEPDSIWSEDEQRRTNAWLDGRSANMEQIKPGVQSIHLIFSDGKVNKQEGAVYQFPYYKRYSQYLDPILDAVLGPADKSKILRLQLARMNPGSVINRHQDSGSWVKTSHRIHVPLISPDGVEFYLCGRDKSSRAPKEKQCSRLLYSEGDVFELNNARMHHLSNPGDISRIHLVVDVLERPVERTVLHPGQVCKYVKRKIVC